MNLNPFSQKKSTKKRSSPAGSRGRSTSSVARKAATGRDVRRRRQTQRRRQFEQRMEQFGARVQQGFAGLPGLDLPEFGPLNLSMPGFSGWRISKIFSLLILVGVGSLFYQFQNDEFFVYAEDVSFQGSTFLERDELYANFGMEDWNILWVDPAQIGAEIAQHPYVADAAVTLTWPAQIIVQVEEISPVATWQTNSEVYWVLDQGVALPSREGIEQPPLTIVDPEMVARAPSAEGKLTVSPRLIDTALAVTELFPGLASVRYDPSVGLNFGIPESSTWVHWGDERRFNEKWLALQTVLPEIREDRTQSRIFNVTAPNRPFFRYYESESANQ